jgi:hypothetical protein
MKPATLYHLALPDWGKAALLAISGAILTSIYAAIQSPTGLDGAAIKTAVAAGVSAGISYLIKNFFTNSNNELATPEPPPTNTQH